MTSLTSDQLVYIIGIFSLLSLFFNAYSSLIKPQTKSEISGNQAGNPGDGGSGVVIIAFPTNGSTGVSTSSTGGTISTVGGNQIHKFTTSGTFTAVLIGSKSAMLSFF